MYIEVSYWEALLLGVLQGLAEFLPISSSGHLTLVAVLFSQPIPVGEQFYFNMFVHVATACSVLVVFRVRLWQLIRGLVQIYRWNTAHTYVSYLLVSSLPVLGTYLLFKEEVKQLFSGKQLLVGGGLLCTSLLLALSHYRSRDTTHQRIARPLGWKVVLAMGLGQAFALLPGVSRSGSTLSMALFMRTNRQEAIEFSFLMMLIPTLGAPFLELFQLFQQPTHQNLAPIFSWSMLLGAGAAFLVGCWTCSRMIAWVKQGRLLYFSAYCFCVGIIAILCTL